MKQIERLIGIRHDVDIGEIYVFSNRHRKEYETFLSLEMARDARRKFDQNKNWWTKVGIHDEYLWTARSRSKIQRDEETGFWYVMVELEDDILVSDLYPRKKVFEVQEYLDDHKWSKQSLNSLKRGGTQAMTLYYGILPTKKGYQIHIYTIINNTIYYLYFNNKY